MYRHMLRHLAADGMEKSPAMTPLEFARQVSREWSGISPLVLPLTEVYHRVRFGREPLAPTERRRAEELLGHLLAARR
jgi:hypothetical protein